MNFNIAVHTVMELQIAHKNHQCRLNNLQTCVYARIASSVSLFKSLLMHNIVPRQYAINSC